MSLTDFEVARVVYDAVRAYHQERGRFSLVEWYKCPIEFTHMAAVAVCKLRGKSCVAADVRELLDKYGIASFFDPGQPDENVYRLIRAIVRVLS
jgi:hypothetical protein